MNRLCYNQSLNESSKLEQYQTAFCISRPMGRRGADTIWCSKRYEFSILLIFVHNLVMLISLGPFNSAEQGLLYTLTHNLITPQSKKTKKIQIRIQNKTVGGNVFFNQLICKLRSTHTQYCYFQLRESGKEERI